MFNNFFKDRKKEEGNEQENEPVDKKGFLSKLIHGMTKTRDNISMKIDHIVSGYTVVDEEMFEEIEDILISADIGTTTTIEVIDQLRDTLNRKKINDPAFVKRELNQIIKEAMQEDFLQNQFDTSSLPMIVLVIGVNGVGKTTSIGKLAHRFKNEGKSVMLAAADTFRAAAIDQLQEWSNRANVDLIAHKEGSDPAAVIYDAIASAKSKGVDILICDTAGRLHNKKNLMNELNKIYRVIEREYPLAKKETLLVLDATTGQNAVSQVKEFKGVAQVDGVILTKMDGTAKGGVVLRIQKEEQVPVKFIGVGEGIDDLQPFEMSSFVDSIV